MHTEPEEESLIDLEELYGEWSFDGLSYDFEPYRTVSSDQDYGEYLLYFTKKGRYYGFFYFKEGDSTGIAISDTFYIMNDNKLVLADSAFYHSEKTWFYYQIISITPYYMELMKLEDCTGSDCEKALEEDTTAFWKSQTPRFSL